jgi:serine O-acetyltransferase
MLSISAWLKVVREDTQVFCLVHPRRGLLKYIYYPDFRVVLIFRLSQLFYSCRMTRPLSYLMTMLNDVLNGVWIGPRVVAGPGLSLAHPRGLVVNPDTIIGRNCSILQRVTIGGPHVVIGDFVSINAGAAIISNIRGRAFLTVGSHAIIGAGAVVVQDVPDCSVVVGVPAKVVKTIKPEDNWYEFMLHSKVHRE